MSATVFTSRMEMDSGAENALRVAVRCWFAVTVVGQVLFAFAVASFYGLTALRGDHHRWSRFITHGWVPGDTMGNLAIAVHLDSASATTFFAGRRSMPSVSSRSTSRPIRDRATPTTASPRLT
jgi:hypothetical protein